MTVYQYATILRNQNPLELITLPPLNSAEATALDAMVQDMASARRPTPAYTIGDQLQMRHLTDDGETVCTVTVRDIIPLFFDIVYVVEQPIRHYSYELSCAHGGMSLYDDQLPRFLA